MTYWADVLYDKSGERVLERGFNGESHGCSCRQVGGRSGYILVKESFRHEKEVVVSLAARFFYVPVNDDVPSGMPKFKY